MSFTWTQVRVAAGMAGGLSLTIGGFFWPGLPLGPHDVESRLRLWLACSAISAVWLLIGVSSLARHRFMTPTDIDGGGADRNSTEASIHQAILQNTLEQTMIAVIAYGGWLWLGPADRAGLVVVFAGYFALGRLLFFFGYRHGAPGRALGFALTFYPSVGLYLAILPTAFDIATR